jgi:hypothetical protein
MSETETLRLHISNLLGRFSPPEPVFGTKGWCVSNPLKAEKAPNKHK